MKLQRLNAPLAPLWPARRAVLLGATVLLVLLGLFIPPASLIDFLRPGSASVADELLLGAALFKIGLVSLGLLVFVLSRLPIWGTEADWVGPARERPDRAAVPALVAILVAASGLRFYGLEAGLWYDEIVTYVRYAPMPFGQIATTFDSQNQNFLYSLLAHAAFELFGASAWALRLPAVLFGIASIWAVYRFGREVGSTAEALLASALLTFSYHHIWFSQNARGYTGLLFWTLVSGWLLLRALREGRPTLWLLYATATALGVYTHLTMLFVIAGHGLTYLSVQLARRGEAWPHRWQGLVLGFGVAGCLILLLHAFVLPQILGGSAIRDVSAVSSWKNPLWTVLEFFRGLEVGYSGGVVVGAVVLVFGAGLAGFARTNGLVVQLLLLPVALSAALNLATGHPLWPRFFFFAAGFAVLVVVRGTLVLAEIAARVPRLPAGRAALIGPALVAGFVFVSLPSIRLAYAPKQDYLGALAFVESRKQPGDAIVTVGLATFPYRGFYRVDWSEARSLDDLNAVRSGARRTWLLYTLPLHLRATHPEIWTAIQQEFTLVELFKGTVGDGSIFVYRSDTAPPPGSAHAPDGGATAIGVPR